MPAFRRKRPKRARRKDHSQKIDIFSNHDSNDVPQDIFTSFPHSQWLSNQSSIGQMIDTSLDDFVRVWDTFTIFPYQQQLSDQSNIGQETHILPNPYDAFLDALLSPQQLPDQSNIDHQIDILPDDVLLEIFAFYLQFNSDVEAWHTLVHVCRLWRLIVFASTRRLDIQILCTHKTPAREISDVWPALPIQVIMTDGYPVWPGQDADNDNIIAALEHNDRISQITLTFYQSSLQGRLATVMQQPFPSLTYLNLKLGRGETSVLPKDFLGGSAPCLRSCCLDGIAYQGLWSLLLTSHHLVDLALYRIPQSGYISPEAIVPYLSAMPNLKQLHIGFQSTRSSIDQPDPPKRYPPPLTRVVLPSLTSFSFYGISEYAEDLVSRIDVPLLNYVYIRFFDQLIFHTPRLHTFLSCAKPLTTHNRATLRFWRDVVNFERNSMSLLLTIFCSQSNRQLSAMAQLCRSSLPPFSDLEALQIREEDLHSPDWHDDMDHSQWLELMRPFSSVKNLYLSQKVAPRVALALKELTGGVRETLPALQNLFVEGLRQWGPAREAITQFIITRRLSGYPVTLHRWNGRW